MTGHRSRSGTTKTVFVPSLRSLSACRRPFRLRNAPASNYFDLKNVVAGD